MGAAVRTSFGGSRAGVITSETAMFASEGVALAPTRRFTRVVLFTILALVALMVIFASTGGVLASWSRTGPRSSRGRGHRYPGSGDPDLSWAAHWAAHRRAGTEREEDGRHRVPLRRLADARHLGRGPGRTPALLQPPVSVYSNRELDYRLHESVRIIGADCVRSGLGYDGNGVGVTVIDSGVDGSNRDARYPGRLVQNVKIANDAFFTGRTPPASPLSASPPSG